MQLAQPCAGLLNTPPRLFFLLPLELRTIIYTLLLTSHSDIFIPADLFKRQRKLRRQNINQAPSAIPDPPMPYICDVSTKVPCPHWPTSSRLLHPSHARSTLDTAILLACHQINAEASPLLYQRNTFHFEDPNIASSFRWGTNQALASQVSSLHIAHGPIYLNAKFNSLGGGRRRGCRDGQWHKYLAPSRSLSLSTDFPHLKYLTLTLGRELETASRFQLKYILGPWVCALQNQLKWVQIIGLNDEILLSYLAPLISPIILLGDAEHRSHTHSELPDVGADGTDEDVGGERDADDDSKPRVHTLVSEYAARPGWKNAILWWGTSKKPPCQIRPFEGDPRWRRRLYRLMDEEVRLPWLNNLCVGQSYSEGLG